MVHPVDVERYRVVSQEDAMGTEKLVIFIALKFGGHELGQLLEQNR